MAERFHADVVQDFVSEYARGNTPNPCLRCNEKIKFAAVLDRAVALGFDAVCTGHHARLEPVPGAPALTRLVRSVDPAKDQSYVLAVLTSEQLSRAMFPLGDTTKDQVRKEAAERGLASPTSPTAMTSASSPTATPGASCSGSWAARPASIVEADGTVVGHARRQLRLHHRPAQGPRHRPACRRRPAAVRAQHRAGVADGHRRPGRGAGRAGDRGRPGRSGRAARRRRGRSTAWSSCARTARCTRPSASRTATWSGSACASPPAASPPARRRSSTTATPSSAARRSSRLGQPARRAEQRRPANGMTLVSFSKRAPDG